MGKLKSRWVIIYSNRTLLGPMWDWNLTLACKFHTFWGNLSGTRMFPSACRMGGERGGHYHACFLCRETETGSTWARDEHWDGSASLPPSAASPSSSPSGAPPSRARRTVMDSGQPSFSFPSPPLLSLLPFPPAQTDDSANARDPEKLSSLLFHRIIFCPLVWTSLGDF